MQYIPHELHFPPFNAVAQISRRHTWSMQQYNTAAFVAMGVPSPLGARSARLGPDLGGLVWNSEPGGNKRGGRRHSVKLSGETQLGRPLSRKIPAPPSEGWEAKPRSSSTPTVCAKTNQWRRPTNNLNPPARGSSSVYIFGAFVHSLFDSEISPEEAAITKIVKTFQLLNMQV